MNLKQLVLTGAVLVLSSLTADAQRRGGGRGNFVTPGIQFGSVGGVGIGVGPGYGSGGLGGVGFQNFNYGYGYKGFNNYGYNPYYGYNRGFTYGTPNYGRQSYHYNTPGTTYYTTPNTTYYTTPSTTYYSTPSTYVTPATYTVPSTTVVTPSTSSSSATQWGLKVIEQPNGGAKAAGLELGDIILKVDNQRTQTFTELRNVLSATNKSEVEVEFIDVSTGNVKRKDVKVQSSKIGVTVEETALANQ